MAMVREGGCYIYIYIYIIYSRLAGWLRSYESDILFYSSLFYSILFYSTYLKVKIRSIDQMCHEFIYFRPAS